MTTTPSPMRRRSVLAGALVALACATASPSANAESIDSRWSPRPTTYTVPTTEGVGLEGIEAHRGTMYVGSVTTGNIYRGSVRDSSLELWLPGGQDGRGHVTGIHVDPSRRVLMAGAVDGTFHSYSQSGEHLQTRSVTGEAFLNDFVVLGKYVYVTDSAQGIVWRAPIDARGIGQFTAWAKVEGADFINGIAASPNGRYLIVTDWLGSEQTYRIDTRSAEVRTVQIKGGTFPADGLVLTGHTAVGVVTNWDADLTTLRTVRFNADFTVGRVVADSTGVSATTEGPTTVARDRGRWLWVNGQLNTDSPRFPHTVTEVR